MNVTFESLTRRSAGVMAAALVTAACGSTLPTAEQQAAEEASEQGLAVANGELGDGSGDTGLGGGVISNGGSGSEGTSVGGAAGGIDTQSGTGPSDGRSVRSGVNGTAHGVTSTTIALGLPVTEDVSTANRAAGASASTSIDYRRAWEAIVDRINDQGGIAGRKVRPLYHTTSAYSAKTNEQRAQDACAHWTQDHEVFAALVDGYPYEAEALFACLEKAGVALINGTSIRSFFDERIFPRYPHMIVPFGTDLSTQASSLVDGLANQRYFGKGAKLGLLTYDDPGFTHATEQALIPKLKSHGLKLTSWVRLRRPQSYGEYGQFSNEVGNAVLKFKTEGITHVMILDVGATISFFYMQAAEKQQYRPRYGLTSQAGNTALADLIGNDARNQLQGARSIGWIPIIDLRPEDDPNSEANAPRQRCLQLMRENGVEMTTRAAEWTALTLCDEMWFLKAVLETGGEPITLDSFLSGVDRLGTSYESAVTPFRTSLSGTRHDGLGAVANMSFFGACTCFRYTSKPRAIPN